MNDMPWENVICEAKKEETTEKGSKVFIQCDGVMLPVDRIERNYGLETGNYVDTKMRIWVCHKCGREVK